MMSQYKNNGFSLIELMVVIAIIAVLAAIAVPVYKTYVLRAKLNEVVGVISTLAKNSIEYSSKHGYFGNAYELGLSANPGIGVDAPKALSRYFRDTVSTTAAAHGLYSSPLSISDAGPTTCGQVGLVEGNLDTTELGIGSDVDTFFVECIYFNHDSTIKQYCNYAYGGAESKTDNLIPGWVNANTTSGWDLSHILIGPLPNQDPTQSECQ